MGRLLFIGPWWVRILVSAGLVCLAVWFWQLNGDKLAAREALIAQDPPAMIPIAEMTPDHDLDVQEVSLRAVVALKHNTHLVEKTNFVTTNEDLMYVLQDEDAAENAPLVRAVILVEPAQKDSFIAWVLAHSVDYTATGPVIELNGLIGDSRNWSHVSKALRDAGLTEAPNFAQVEPFLVSRASALQQLPADSNKLPLMLLLAAAVMAFIGLVERRGSAAQRAAQGVAARFASAPQAGPTPLPADQIEARLAQPMTLPPRAPVDARFSTALSADDIEARLAAPLNRRVQFDVPESPSEPAPPTAPRFALPLPALLVLVLGVLLVLAAGVGVLMSGVTTVAGQAPAAGPTSPLGDASAVGQLIGTVIALALIPIIVVWKLIGFFSRRSAGPVSPAAKGAIPLGLAVALYFGLAKFAPKLGLGSMQMNSLPAPTGTSPDAFARTAIMALPQATLPGLAVIAVLLLAGFVLRNGGWRTRHDTSDSDPWSRIERERLR